MPPKRRLRWKVILAWELPLFVLAGAALSYWSTPHPAVPIQPALGLRLHEKGEGQLQVEWKPAADAVRAATRGQLEIRDGVLRHVIPLTPELLAAGSFTHLRTSDSVDVRLSVFDADNRRAVESSGFIGLPLPSVVPEPAHTELRGQVVELEGKARWLRHVSQMQSQRVDQLQKELDAVEARLGISERNQRQ